MKGLRRGAGRPTGRHVGRGVCPRDDPGHRIPQHVMLHLEARPITGPVVRGIATIGRYDILHEIEQLDPERDHQRVMHLSFGYEFPWDSIRALEMALYRTYCVPSISKLLDRTGEFANNTQRRYDDTSILVAQDVPMGVRKRPWQENADFIPVTADPDSPHELETTGRNP